MAKNVFISSELSLKLIIFLLLIIAVKCQEKDISEEESLEAQLENNKLLLSKIRDKLNSFHHDRHKFKRSVAKNRHARGTFLRMDPNRRTFSSQVLAKKMAEESLRSPKMQETLKRLTEVRSAEGHRKVKKSVPAHSQKHKNLKKKSHKPLAKKKKARHSDKLKKPGHKRSKGSSKSKHSGSIVSKVKDRRDIDKLKLPDKSVKSSRGLLKLDVKRSDVDCTVDRTRIFNPSLVAEQSSNALSRHTRHTFPLLDKFYNRQFNDLLRQNLVGTTDNYLSPYLGPRDKIYYRSRQAINKDPIELNSVDLFDSNYNSELLKNWDDFPFILGKKSVSEEIQNSTAKSVEKGNKHGVKAKVEKVINGDPTCETKEVAKEILNRIIEELEELKIDRNKSFYGEGSPCNVSGNWISVQAGVQLEITTVNRHKLDVKIKKQNFIKTINHRGFLNETWNVTGQSFFGFDAPFSLTAINCHTKSLASFIGTCKTCNGNDMIQGIWTTIHEPHDCRYFSIAINSYNDIFRRIKKN
ncbi:hypothetical protein KQX54_007452 [Cotesia glomerata]|uniref:Uncharacterized protein n=1 Tax=Cotesia glomerata TaxID=32391 RepID=A0AAV7HZ33_COTGL|nr:hypothetical protein KQX54_007452 [Cotesia glomerata]